MRSNTSIWSPITQNQVVKAFGFGVRQATDWILSTVAYPTTIDGVSDFLFYTMRGGTFNHLAP